MLGQRNSVGGDVDPRSGQLWFSENARDWMGDNIPSDKLNHLTRYGEHFGYPYCHQGDIPDPKFNMGHKCDEFTPPVLDLGAHVAPLGMRFYTGNSFPPNIATIFSWRSTAAGTSAFTPVRGSYGSKRTWPASTSRPNHSPGAGSRTINTGDVPMTS